MVVEVSRVTFEGDVMIFLVVVVILAEKQKCVKFHSLTNKFQEYPV